MGLLSIFNKFQRNKIKGRERILYEIQPKCTWDKKKYDIIKDGLY